MKTPSRPKPVRIPSATPSTDEIGQLLHDLREPIGAFVIYLSLLDNEVLSAEGRHHLEAMLGNVQRMVKVVADLAAGFGLERGSSTPLAILSGNGSNGHYAQR
jgi:hypothetical protein